MFILYSIDKSYKSQQLFITFYKFTLSVKFLAKFIDIYILSDFLHVYNYYRLRKDLNGVQEEDAMVVFYSENCKSITLDVLDRIIALKLKYSSFKVKTLTAKKGSCIPSTLR